MAYNPKFLGLLDTPSSYSGEAGNAVIVTVGEDGLEFGAAPGGGGGSAPAANFPIIVEVIEEGTTLTTGTAKATFRMPFAFTLTEVRASLATASTSGAVTVDVNESGTSIFGANKLTIDQDEKTTETAATPADLTDTALAKDAEITVDIDAAGTGAAGLVIYLVGNNLALVPGGDMEVIDRRVTDTDGTQEVSAFPGNTVDFPTQTTLNAADLYTWSAVNKDLTIEEDGLYLVSVGLTFEDDTTLRADFQLEIDTGGGFGSLADGSTLVFDGGSTRHSGSAQIIRQFSAGDKLRVNAVELQGTIQVRSGSWFSVVRLKRGSQAVDFSTTEVKTGRKWVDGKDIYQKVIDDTGGGTYATGATDFNHGITGLDRIIDLVIWLKRDNGEQRSVPLASLSGTTFHIDRFVDSTKVRIVLGTGWTGAGNLFSDAQIQLLYTKT